MSLSQVEDDVEAAEILQNSLYYNYDILDTSLTVVAQYKDQSIAYLGSIIHFAYVLLRMLEKYSKTKSFMFVRKRKAQRKKKKAAEEAAASGRPVPDAEDENVGSDGEADRDAPSYGEHQFKFRDFEMVSLPFRLISAPIDTVLTGQRFAQEAVVNTLLSYLQRWQHFDDPDEMKRVVGLIHRQVVKTQAEGLYFKVSSVAL
jgi:replication fork protection complex subunit Tof1/Swi1